MPEDVIELSPSEIGLEEVRHLIEDGNAAGAVEHLGTLHPADQAAILAELDEDHRTHLLPRIPRDPLAEIIEYLEDEPRREIARELDPAILGPVLDLVDRDVAADVLHDLPQERAQVTIVAMQTAPELAPLLTHADETAGGQMTTDFVALHKEWTVQETLEYLRGKHPAAEQAYYLYAVDDGHRLEGVVSLRQLVVAEPGDRIGSIMAPDVFRVHVNDDQEEVARQAQHYNLVALPVVDDSGVLAGVISIDDLMDVVEAEATEDMYRMAGLSERESIYYQSIPRSTGLRLGWLLVNLVTAFAAAATVNAFEGTIERAAILAVFMPIIAGMGGNAGIQTITLVVRSIALGEVELRDVRHVLTRELVIGVTNGVAIGVLLGVLAFLWKDNVGLGVVAGTAMLLNMSTAVTVGVLVPVTLRAMRLDPALASGVFVTMFTDIMGFFFFLGLATLMIDRIA
jgi:magnesium transporter